ncbi:MAG: hypothetical protein M1821_006497 [Bathelium mastoideum]|nr:MAG: hypothetical protein M1821_006497 [Bathelium mastoideum]
MKPRRTENLPSMPRLQACKQWFTKKGTRAAQIVSKVWRLPRNETGTRQFPTDEAGNEVIVSGIGPIGQVDIIPRTNKGSESDEGRENAKHSALVRPGEGDTEVKTLEPGDRVAAKKDVGKSKPSSSPKARNEKALSKLGLSVQLGGDTEAAEPLLLSRAESMTEAAVVALNDEATKEPKANLPEPTGEADEQSEASKRRPSGNVKRAEKSKTDPSNEAQTDSTEESSDGTDTEDSKESDSSKDSDNREQSDGGTDKDDHQDAQSSASTLEHEHESFATYKDKVRQLAEELGATEIEAVERLTGGSYNRIVVVTARFGEQKLLMKVVFRIVRMAYESEERNPFYFGDDVARERDLEQGVLDSVTVLAKLHGQMVPTPRLLAFDATRSNAINAPYIVQEFAAGERLDYLYKDMPLEEKLMVAGEVANLLGSMESIRFQGAGHIRQAIPLDKIHEDYPLKMGVFDRVPKQLVEQVAFTPDSGHDFRNARRYDTAYDYIRDLIDHQIWLNSHRPSLKHKVDAMQVLKKMLGQMRESGLFDSQPSLYPNANVLYHADLEGRNILVRNSGSKIKLWNIVAVLDWDGAHALPPIITRKPPHWLWDNRWLDWKKDKSLPKHYYGDPDMLPPKWYAPGSTKITEDEHRIKDHFETCFARRMALLYPGYTKLRYLDEAYGRGRMVRRVEQCVSDGLWSTWAGAQLEQLCKEWRKAHPHLPDIMENWTLYGGFMD